MFLYYKKIFVSVKIYRREIIENIDTTEVSLCELRMDYIRITLNSLR